MDILQYFHKKEIMPPFKKGDKVQLKKDSENVRQLYNKEYPNCFCTKEKWRQVFDNLANEKLGWGEHIVSKIIEGTPAAGGFFVYVDNIDIGYHGNIFELVK